MGFVGQRDAGSISTAGVACGSSRLIGICRSAASICCNSCHYNRLKLSIVLIGYVGATELAGPVVDATRKIRGIAVDKINEFSCKPFKAHLEMQPGLLFPDLSVRY
jgi:hypothetical protein